MPVLHTLHLHNLTLSSSGGRQGSVSLPGPVFCESVWLVFVVLLPSRPRGLGGSTALWLTTGDRLLDQYPLVMGPPWAPLLSQLDQLSSVHGPLSVFPVLCWCLTCPFFSLSPFPSLSLLVIVPLLSIPSPSSFSVSSRSSHPLSAPPHLPFLPPPPSLLC